MNYENQIVEIKEKDSRARKHFVIHQKSIEKTNAQATVKENTMKSILKIESFIKHMIYVSISRQSCHKSKLNKQAHTKTVSKSHKTNLFLITTLFLMVAMQVNFLLAASVNKGIYNGVVYDSSNIETINNTSGNLFINIPLATLPGGRGGEFQPSINLLYNSKLWKTTTSGYIDANQSFHSQIAPDIDPDGNWKYGLRYGWRFHTRFEDNPYPYSEGSNDCAIEDVVYQNIAELFFPDGSTHKIHPRGFREVDGFSQVLPNGFGSCTTYSSAVRSYFTDDGTSIRVDFTPRQNGNVTLSPAWTMYFPDGKRVTDDGDGNQTTYDRNGNTVQVTDTTYNGHASTIINDQLGRQIILEHDSGNQKDYIYQNGFNGEQLKWTVSLQNVSIAAKQFSTGDSDQDGNEIFRTFPFTQISGISQIQMPAQLGGQSYSFTYDGDHNNGELKSLTLPTGAQTVYSYTLDNNPSNQTGDFVRNMVIGKTRLYNAEYDGTTSPVTEKWLYTPSGVDPFTGLTGATSSITSPDGQVTQNFYLQAGAGGYTGLEGSPIKTINTDGSTVERIWQLNKIPNRDFVIRNTTGPREKTNAFVKTEFTSIADAGGNLIYTAIRDYDYDKNNNVTKTTEYDWIPYSSVPRDSNGRPTGIPSGLTAKRITQNVYYNPTPNFNDETTDSANIYANASSPNLKGLMASVEILDGNNNVASRSEMSYDNTSTTGNLTESKSWDSSKGAYSNPLIPSNSISVANQYDTYGNVIQTTDAKGIVSTTTYGNITTPSGTISGLYPTQTVAAVGSTEQRTSNMEYDFYTGATTKIIDADNNISTVKEYDALARPIKVRVAADTANEVWTQTQYDDVNRRIITRSDIDVKGDGRKVSIQHLDQLGRIRLSRTLEDATNQSAADETQGIKIQTRYRYDNPADPANSNGSYTLTSNFYRAATSGQAAGETTMGWTLNYSDKTGRNSNVKTFQGADLPTPFGTGTNLTGTVSTVVDANATTLIDQAGKQKRSVTDGLGQLTRVDEPDDTGNLGTVSNPNQPTNYDYNILGKMTKVTQGVQSRYFKYDSLSRLIRVRQPEQDINPSLALSDSTTGNNNWSAGFTYDGNGNMLTTTDTKGIVITNVYDNLNRVVTRSYSDSTPQVTFTYDDPNIQYAKGKLTKVSNAVSTSQILSFDNLGRTLSSRQTTDGNNYDSSYSYNLAGDLVEETYPSGRKVKNSFQSDGNLSKIETMPSGGGYTTRADNFSYSPTGIIEKLKLGNNLWETAQFNSRVQVTELGLGISQTDTSIWKLNYDFGTTDNNGSIKSQTITSPVGTFVQNFAYDALNRLKSANETAGGNQTWTQNFNYDRYGNRTGFNQTLNGQITNQTPSIDANTNRFATGQGYTYDLAGNIVVDGQGRQFSFNGDNKQSEVKDSQNQTIGQYFYDGDGKRIKKITPQESTTFVYSGGKLVAEYTNSTAAPTTTNTQYLGTDMLGSPRVITDQSGNVISRRDFLPFGEDLTRAGYGTDTIRQKFTGYQRDNETNLDFAEARYYASTNGRFTAVDPLLASGKPTDPQTFNRYSYGLNNPLIMTDSSGMQTGRRVPNYNGAVYTNGNDGYSNRRTTEFPTRYKGDTRYVVDNGNQYKVTSKGWSWVGIPPASEPANTTVSAPTLDQKIAQAEEASWMFRYLIPRSLTATLVGSTPSERSQASIRFGLDVGNFIRSTAVIQQGLNSEPETPGGVVTNEVGEEELYAATKMEADIAQGSNPRPLTATGLLVRGRIFTGTSVGMGGTGDMPPNLTPRVRSLYNIFGAGLTRQNGCCGEAQVLTQAENAGVNVEGGTVMSLRIRGPVSSRHATPIDACPSCRPVLDHLNVNSEVRNEP